MLSLDFLGSLGTYLFEVLFNVKNLSSYYVIRSCAEVSLKSAADSTFSTSLINRLTNSPLRQKPPLLKSTQSFATAIKIHSAFFHHY